MSNEMISTPAESGEDVLKPPAPSSGESPPADVAEAFGLTIEPFSAIDVLINSVRAPLDPRIKTLQDVFALPPTKEEIQWMRRTDEKPWSGNWLTMAIMAIRTKEYLVKEDFPDHFRSQMFPNSIRNLDGVKMMRRGSANFFRKVIQAAAEIEEQMDGPCFDSWFIEAIQVDPFVASVVLLHDSQLLSRVRKSRDSDDYLVNRPHFFSQLQRIRVKLGTCHDFGFGTPLMAEGNNVVDMISTVGEWTLEKVNTIWQSVLSIIKNVGGRIVGAAHDLMKWLDSSIMSRVEELLERVGKAALSKVLKFFVGVLVGCVFALFGIMTWKKAKEFLWHTSETELQAEASTEADFLEEDEADSAIPFFSGWIGRLLDLSDKTVEKLAARAKSLMALSSLTGLAVSTAASVLLYGVFIWTDGVKALVPNGLKVDERDWVERAVMTTALSKDQGVVFSKDYSEAVFRLLKEGKELCLKEMDLDNRMTVTRLFGEVFRISSMIEQSKNKTAKRITPYVVALWGPPGTGKTDMAGAIARALMPGADMYARGQEEYWSGYANEEVVLYDEFMAHPDCGHDKEYLTLISSEPCMPSFASVDNPGVGIKGTYVSPKLVITTSNAKFPKVQVSNSAFQRRRNVNLKITLTEEAKAKWTKEGVLDMRKVPRDIVRSRGYLQVEFTSRMYTPGKEATCKKFPFAEALRRIKADFDSHIEMGEFMLRTEGLAPSKRPAVEIMDEVLLKLRTGTPPRKPTFMDFLNLAGEGKRNRRKERPEDFDAASESSNPDPDAITVDENYQSAVESSDDDPDRHFETQDDEIDILDVDEYGIFLGREVPVPKRTWSLVACVPLLVWSLWTLGKWFLGKSTHPTEEVLEMEGQSPGKRAKRMHKREQPKFRGGEGQGGKPMDANVGVLTLDGVSLHCTFLSGRTFVAPAHVFRGDDGAIVPDGTKMRVITDQNSVDLKFSKSCARYDFSNDVLFYRIPTTTWKPLKDLSARLIHEDELEEVGASNACFRSGEEPRYVRVTRVPQGSYKYGDTTYQVKQGLLYALHTKVGDCGSFITLCDGKYNGKIVGMHVAGSTDKRGQPVGFSTPLTAEMLSKAFEDTDVEAVFDDGVAEGQNEEDVAKYLDKVESHKRTILKLGLQVPGRPVPWVRLRRHDDSKFTKAEVAGYVDRWIKGEKTERWERALEHHYANNPHHPQWWGGESMDEVSLKESVIDALACMWERDHGLARLPLSQLAVFDDQGFERYCPEDVPRVKAFLAELRASGVVLDPDFDACQWGVDFRKNVDTFAEIVEGPNVAEVTTAPFNNVAPSTSKLRPTIFHGVMGQPKQIAILGQDDLRSRGYDPLVKGAILAGKNVQVPINLKVLARAEKECEEWFKNRVCCRFDRELTFEEAIGGVPGLLKPIDTKTSCGYPLINERTKQGKRDFIENTPDGPVGTPYLKERVLAFIEDLKSGKDMESVFLAHCKDERVSDAKIDDVRTRIVYCGDLVANVAFRMLFGAGLINFNNNGADGPPVIGVNPMSHDHQAMKDYLDEIGDGEYLAGDYKAFDLRYQRPVRDAAYRILGRLLKFWVPTFDETAWLGHTKHQTDGARVQFGRFLVKFIALHFSGLFWTTIINILTNDLNVRMAFNIVLKDLPFDKHVRAQEHGDDNRLKFSRKAVESGLTPIKFAQAMATIGQEYTSDIKGEALGTDFKPFDKCSFLGAFPCHVDGIYSGGLRLASAYDAIQWKRDYESEEETINQMLDLMSQWDIETYTKYHEKLLAANDGKYHIPKDSYKVRQGRQAARKGVPQWIAEAPEKPIITIETATKPVVLPARMVNSELACQSIQAGPMGMAESLAQKVFRKAVYWDENGLSEPVAIKAPYGFLELGEQGSMQNMAFDMMIWFVGTTVVDIQLNAQPMSQGTLVAYWRPLAESALSPGRALTCHKILLQPGTTSYQLRIPFMFPRGVTNNFARSEGDGSLGTFHLDVLNPLKAGPDVQARATVSIFSSFEDVKMTLPKPLGPLPERKVKAKWLVEPEGADFAGAAQGGGQSTTVNNTYIQTTGDVPFEIDNSGQTSSGAEVEASAEVDAEIPIPMDKPPLVGGGFPVYQQYSGMAKGNGVNPTVGMSLHPQQMFRTRPDTMPLGSQELKSMMQREERARVLMWATSDLIGTKLGEWQIRLGDAEPATIHQYIGGLFQFWRSSYRARFLAAKTKFHTGKLRVVVGYGVPAGITFEQSSNYEAWILDFEAETADRTVDVVYNAQTPWLKTWSGPVVADPVQDHDLATMAVFVQNELVAPDVVPQEVEVNIIESYPDCQLAVPRPMGFLHVGAGDEAECLGPVPELQAEAPVKVAGLEENGETSVAEPDEPKKLTNEECTMKRNLPCKVLPGEHFEYAPKTVSEVGRRYVQLVEGRDFIRASVEHTAPGGAVENHELVVFQVRPIHPFTGFFAGWKGSVNARVFNSGWQGTDHTNPKAIFIPSIENLQETYTTFKPIDFPSYFGPGLWKTTYARGGQTIEATSRRQLTETTSPPIEALYPVAFGKGYIDLMVPFQTIFNFLPIQDFSSTTRLAVSVGQVGVLVPAGSSTEVFTAFADDLVVGGFAGMGYSPIDYQISTQEVVPFGMNVA